MALMNNFVIISLMFSLIYFIGLLSFITDKEENKCEMTYMFEYPQFVKISMPNNIKYSKYGLYAYSEGKFTERARAMRFDGIPVLFVPGNAGSYKQVRSLASIALRKALNSRSRFHFDFFTIDLNDELSGLNGALLNEQTQFLNESIQRILTLYQKSKTIPPKSVILIGHSMGGVIAHSQVVNSEIKNVELLITMGSPHRSPMIAIDRHMRLFYDDIYKKIGNTKLYNQTFISIGAGIADKHVNSWLTNANTSSLNVLSTAVPGAWLTMDHACIVWCKQLVLATIRALFDSINPNTRQLSSEHTFRLAAFRHHLLLNSCTKYEHASKYRMRTKLEPKGDWQESIHRQYTITTSKGKNIVNYYMIRLFDDVKYQSLFVQTINLESPDWIFACTASTIQGQSRICDDDVMHLSHRSQIAPSARKTEKRRIFYLDLFRLKKRYPEFTHVVIKILPASEPRPVILNFDLHNPIDRTVTAELPGWYSLTRKVILKETFPEALRYVIELPGFTHIAQTYLLYLEPISCTTTSHQATVTAVLPWAHHDVHTFITEGIKKPLVLRLHNSRPAGVNSTAKVLLNLDSHCRYSVSIRSSFIGMLSQMSRYYSPLLLANMAAVILVAYYSQMMHLNEERKCLSFQSALSMSTKPYYIVTTAKLLSRAFRWLFVYTQLPGAGSIFLVSVKLVVIFKASY